MDPVRTHKAGPSSSGQDMYSGLPWSKGPKDFVFGKVLGEGAYSKVVLGRELGTSREYAIKVLLKKKIVKEKKGRYVASELGIMARLDHPLCVKLHCAFQDKEKLYLVLNYAKNGDLQRCVGKVGRLDEPCTRFYSAEIVSALEYLHSRDIIHRDLKPENILLNGDMHIQIADFGLAKILNCCQEQDRNSFVGTVNYLSPEVLLGNGVVCKSSDLWALGCVIYKLLTGQTPFQAPNLYLTSSKIAQLEYDFPEYFLPKARDLVRKLLVLDSTSRLGCEEMAGYEALKIHPFFDNITWDNLHLQTPPRVPGCTDFTSKEENDFGNFDFLQSPLPPASCHHSSAATQPSSLQPVMARVEGSIHQLDVDSLELDLGFSAEEKRLLLEKQARRNPWHRFVNKHLILKMGPVDNRKCFFDPMPLFARKGLFPRKGIFTHRYQLLLTEGPHLYYVDPINKLWKGEIPWSPQLWPEAKNFKTFLIHTPKKTYYLMDPNGNAHKWCQKIKEVSRRRSGYHC